MSHRLQFRRDTHENWLKYDPILLEGEVGYELDTKNGKVGDGIHRYSELEYTQAVTFEIMTSVLGDSEKLVPTQKLLTQEINSVNDKLKNVITSTTVQAIDTSHTQEELEQMLKDGTCLPNVLYLVFE